jgi:hypothetical protein
MPEWLDEFGRRVAGDLELSPPEFLVEWRITQIEFSQLCEALSRADYDVLGRDRQVALAVAAVQIAANAEADEQGFRQLFFRTLGLAFDVNRWEFVFGPAILRVLDRYFPETVSLERKGPFRYVSPIYRHSGLPGKGLSAFAKVLAGAVRSHGTIFSYEQYRRTLPASLPRLVREFLKSPAGYQFTLQSARLLTRIRAGLVPRAEVGDISGYRHNFWPELLEHLEPDKSAIPKPTKLPWLALDTGSLRLVLRFDPDGISARKFAFGGRTITSPEMPLSNGTRPTVVLRDGDLRWQPDLKLWWWPSQDSAALFRESDGAFVACAGAVRPGTYHLVLPGHIQPESSVVHEELGAIVLPDQDEHLAYYFVYRVKLPPSFQVRGTSLSTTSGIELPQLHLEGFSHPRLGRTVFVDEPPRLRLDGWSAQTREQYWLLLNDGSGDRRLDVAVDSGEVPLSLAIPCHARVWIESRGFKRQAEALPDLTFSVVPRGFQFRWLPAVSSFDDPSALLARFPRTWSLDCADGHITSSPARIGVPPSLRILDFRFRRLGFELPVSLQVPRATAALIGKPTESIGWLEETKDWMGFHLEAPVGHSVTVCLAAGGRSTALCEAGRMPRNGTKDLQLIEFRDALHTARVVSARVLLRFGENTFVKTDLYIASAERVKQALLEGTSCQDLFTLPGIGAALKTAWEVLQPGARVRVEPALKAPESLQRWVLRLAWCAHVFDSNESDAPPEGELRLPPEYEALRNWVRQARSARLHLAPTPPFPDALEAIAQDMSAVRWRQELATLRGPAVDVVRIVRDWKYGLDTGMNRGDVSDSELARMPGGVELSQGYRKYQLASAGDLVARTRQGLFVKACKNLEAAVHRGDDDVLIPAIANALRQLVLYRMGDASAVQQTTLSMSTGPLACLATSTLALSSLVQGRPFSATWPEGIGFAEISPAADDAELEKTLGRRTLLERMDVSNESG